MSSTCHSLSLQQSGEKNVNNNKNFWTALQPKVNANSYPLDQHERKGTTKTEIT